MPLSAPPLAAGGEPMRLGDASFWFRAFPRLALAAVLWLGEEDLPGSREHPLRLGGRPLPAHGGPGGGGRHAQRPAASRPARARHHDGTPAQPDGRQPPQRPPRPGSRPARPAQRGGHAARAGRGRAWWPSTPTAPWWTWSAACWTQSAPASPAGRPPAPGPELVAAVERRRRRPVAAQPAAGHQRHRRHHPHQPGPRAPQRRRPGGHAGRGRRLLQPGVRPGRRRARLPPQPPRGAARAAGGRRGRAWWSTTTPRRCCWPCRPLAKGREVIVSRGQVVEIGGRFRIPDVMRQSGCKLVEVGTTNRTRLADYEEAITPRTAALLHVHTSNFRVIGFTEEVGHRRAGRPGQAARRRRAGRPGQRRAAGHRRATAWPTSPRCRRAWPRAPTWSASPATSCWAGRRRA